VIGQTNSQDRIVERLGGGTGVVYKAKTFSPQRRVALKLPAR